MAAVSNAAVATVSIGRTGGAFDERGTIVGTICPRPRTAGANRNPGVRIWLEDGTSAVTDEEGKYHFEGVSRGCTW